MPVSNPVVHAVDRYFSLFIAICGAIGAWENDEKIYIGVIAGVLSVGYYFIFARRIKMAELSNNYIILSESNNLKFDWRNIKSVEFIRIPGIYRLTVDDKVHYFSVDEFSLVLFGERQQTPMDIFINKKKNEYNL